MRLVAHREFKHTAPGELGPPQKCTPKRPAVEGGGRHIWPVGGITGGGDGELDIVGQP